jgi:ferredoxin, 2Fe-2S
MRQSTENQASVPKVTFLKPDGTRSVIEAKVGATLMQAGIDNGINGIVAECGGCCQCATCHVYVAAEWRPRLPPVTESEEAMLDNTVCERLPESRLSCEIKVTAEMDGLVVRLPARQV